MEGGGEIVAGHLGNASSTQSSSIQLEDAIARLCYESDNFQKFQYTIDDILLAASMAATVFNVMVIFCAVKLFKKSGDTMHLFIVSMTLGDLLLTVFCHPNEFLTRKHSFLQNESLCAIIHFCNWIGLAVSGLSLTMLNVDKLIYFQWPLSYDRAMSKTRALIFCFLIWGVSFGYVSYVWIFNVVYVGPECSLQMNSSRPYFYEFFMVMFCVLPVSSSMLVTGYLYRLTREKRSALACIGQNTETPTFKNKMKSLVFIFATTAWTSFSLLPYRIFNIYRLHLFDWHTLDCEQRERMNWLAWILLYLLTVNPVINPLITALIYAPYRITIKRFLINIPITNRPLYSYKGDQTDTSYTSVRRTRNRRSSSSAADHELGGLRRGGEVRISVNSATDTPWTSTDFADPKKAERTTFVYGERPKSGGAFVSDGHKT